MMYPGSVWKHSGPGGMGSGVESGRYAGAGWGCAKLSFTCIPGTQLGVVFKHPPFPHRGKAFPRNYHHGNIIHTSRKRISGRGGSRLTEQRNVDGLPTAALYMHDSPAPLQ